MAIRQDDNRPSRRFGLVNLLLIGFWTAPVRIVENLLLPWCRNTLISFPVGCNNGR